MNDCIFSATNDTVPYHNLIDNLKMKRRVSVVVEPDWQVRMEWSRTVAPPGQTETETWEMPTYSLSVVVLRRQINK